MVQYLVTLGLCIASVRACAQGPDVEAWMKRHFGQEEVAQDPAADSALYTAFHLDSLWSNRFIGIVRGTFRHRTAKAEPEFVLWADTLEALLRLTGNGDTTIYHADLRSNTLIIAQVSGTERRASINDLRVHVALNRIITAQDGWTEKVFHDPQGANKRSRYTVIKGDTVRFERDGSTVSPFRDAMDWMPFTNSYPMAMFSKLGHVGDPLPGSMTYREFSMTVTAIKPSERSKPFTFDRTGYHPIDKRTSSHQVVPIRRSNARTKREDLPSPSSAPQK